MTYARDERRALADLFAETGPDRPTLCEGWTTRDLAAHLVVRDRRPDSAAGLLVPALRAHGERVRLGVAAKPWAEVVELVRNPPWWSPVSNPLVEPLTNTTEFFVHHEDVRRGAPGWEPRPADATRDAQLWALLLRTGRFLHRGSPTGVVVRRPSGEQHVLRTGSGVVTIVGEPGELVLHAFGRDAVRVELEGAPADVAALAGSSRGI